MLISFMSVRVGKNDINLNSILSSFKGFKHNHEFSILF
ncbi:hypothetical protein BBU64B_Y0011 (plasmid) [Borreliella burgdorferi 64b]|nr:hypothetical protein BBU64B_Y0011 [Borreliella burgdorferi 64b]